MKPQLIKIPASKIKKGGNPHSPSKDKKDLPCPYKLLNIYHKLRGPYRSRNEPFFVFKDHSPVKPSHIRKCFKLMLKLGNFSHRELYQVHGIRTGRSVDLLNLGLSVETIMKIGHWRSWAIYRYLR